jgi:glycerol-3-phosphate dehydrogenase
MPRPSLEGDHFHVVVIGGGINGVAVARECARAGKRVLLLEQHDFASGTTSRSTRIIHGGLRYLEHGEIGLVRESLRERDRLLRERPHLVHAKRFVLALPKRNPLSRRGSLAVRAGLAFYKQMAEPLGVSSQADSFESALDTDQSLAIYDYEDAQCEFPERLVAEWLAEAAFAGARVRNYVRVLQIGRESSGLAVRVVDLLRDEEASVTADVVVNASGPWVDEVCAKAFNARQRLIGGVRGSHILIDRFPGAPDSPVYSEAHDSRAFFVVPWNAQLLVGTTEVRDTGDPAQAIASEEEIVYLIASFNRLSLEHKISRADVLATFSGVRPLPATSARDASAITRRSFIHDHRDDGLPGLYSLIGGKLTTAASLARQCAKKIGIHSGKQEIAVVALGLRSGFDNSLQHWANQVSKLFGITAGSALVTAEWHGRCALSILRRTQADASLAQPIVEGSEHLLAEAVHAAEREFAVSLADILLRRVPIALTAHWSDEQSLAAGQRIGRALQWNEKRTMQELAAFQEERERLLHTSTRSRFPVGTQHAA